MRKCTSYGTIECTTHVINRFRERSEHPRAERMNRGDVIHQLRHLIRRGEEVVGRRKFHVFGQTFHIIKIRIPQKNPRLERYCYALMNRTNGCAVVRTLFTEEQFRRWLRRSRAPQHAPE